MAFFNKFSLSKKMSLAGILKDSIRKSAIRYPEGTTIQWHQKTAGTNYWHHLQYPKGTRGWIIPSWSTSGHLPKGHGCFKLMVENGYNHG